MSRSHPKATKAAPPSPVIPDPIEFWRAQHVRARLDAEAAREAAPSVVPQHVKLEREAWRELQSAIAAKEDAPEVPVDGLPRLPEFEPGSLEAELHEVRRMRKEAQAGQKLTAAEKLLRREGEIAAAIRARDEASQKAARKGLTQEELVSALVARVAAMPASMQDEIRRSLGWI